MSAIDDDRLAEIMGELSQIEATSADKEAAIEFLRPLYVLDFRLAYEFAHRALRAGRPFEALHVLNRHFPAMSTNSWFVAMLATALALSRTTLGEMEKSITAALPLEWQETVGLHRLPALDLHIETVMLAGANPDLRLIKDYARQCPASAVPERIVSLAPVTFIRTPYETEQLLHRSFAGSPVYFEDPTSPHKPDTSNASILDCTPTKFTRLSDAKLYMLPEMFGLLEVAPAHFSGESHVGATLTGDGRLITQYGSALWKDRSHPINILPARLIEEPVLVPLRLAGSYYFHFITETIQMIYASREILQDTTILLPASDAFYDRIPRHVYEDAVRYATTPQQKICWLDEGVYNLEEVYIAARYNYTNLSFQNAVTARILEDGVPDRDERIVYVARRHHMTRAVLNENEITSMLVRQFNAEIVYLENLSFAQQVVLFKNAKMIIGPHGGGLTNMVFCKPGTVIIEFQVPQMGVMYWHLAALGQLPYVAYVPAEGELTSGNSGSFRVDPEKLASMVETMMSAAA